MFQASALQGKTKLVQFQAAYCIISTFVLKSRKIIVGVRLAFSINDVNIVSIIIKSFIRVLSILHSNVKEKPYKTLLSHTTQALT